MPKLVIVESPNKVKSIAGYLGDEYVVDSSVGHIRDLPKSRLGVDLDNDFAPTYIVLSKTEDFAVNLFDTRESDITPRGLVVENEGLVWQPIVGLVLPISDIPLKDFALDRGDSQPADSTHAGGPAAAVCPMIPERRQRAA